MLSVEYFNRILTLDVSKSKVKYKNYIVDLQNSCDGFYKRKYDYAVVIIGLYGAFEQYIENFIRDYLALLVDECKEYSNLPKLIVNKHVELSILLLGKIDQSKYNGIITREQIIRNLNDCIQYNKCVLNYEAFCQHSANFRIQTLREVLSNVGLAEITNSIKGNQQLRALYIEQNGECNYDNLGLDNVFSFLNDLADRRNQIAHGAIEDILSYDLQLKMIREVKLFVQEMDKLGFEKILSYLVGRSYKICKIHNPNDTTKLLCFRYDGKQICVGDVIIKKSHDKFTFCKIESIEVEHIKYNQYESNREVDIGVMLEKNRKKDEEYWLYPITSD